MKELKINAQTFINRNCTSTANYLRDISRIGKISPEEEIRLATLIKKGGREGELAKEKLITANLRFVVSVANKYTKYGMELSDLISEGNIGLIKAAENYKETLGFKFISYAVWWIRQSIMTAIANNGSMIRIPINKQKMIDKYKRIQNDVLHKELRELSIREFADNNGYDEVDIADVIHASSKASSIDAPINEDSIITFLDLMLSDSVTDKNLDIESLSIDLKSHMLNVLTTTESTVLRKYFGIDCVPASLCTIATIIGRSRERTRQICIKAIEKLRNSPDSYKLAIHLAA